MNIKELTVSVGRTVNLGNFESLRIDVSASATLDPTESADQKRAELSNWLRHQVQKTISDQR